MYAQPKALIFLGPPGSGKGTQAARLSAALEIPAISTGDILRRECQSGSRLGRKVDTTLRSGGLVDDNLMNQIVENRLAHKDCKGGCILDGFPRTVEQARHLDSVLRHVGMRKPIVFDFAVSAEALIERLARRRQCPTCGRIYSSDPDNSGPVVVCRNDGAKLVTRADDRPAVVEERFRVYEENARHLFLFYQRVELHRIKAGQPVDDVTDQLLHALGLSGVGRRVGTPSKLAVATC
ncbi:MAG TPA: nucleoside monophosphate kinase [Bryobacteraceae bacterium]|jgi:adenylate kinase